MRNKCLAVYLLMFCTSNYAVSAVDELQVVDDLQYLVKQELYGVYDIESYSINKISKETVTAYASVTVVRNQNKPPKWYVCVEGSAGPLFDLICQQAGFKKTFHLKLDYFHTRKGYMLHIPVRLRAKAFGPWLDEVE